MTHESQYQIEAYRLLDRAQDIRIRLGGTGIMDEPFWPKPKGMHWKTYAALCAKADWYGRQADRAMCLKLGIYA